MNKLNSDRYNHWLETDNQSITYALTADCLNWLNEQIQEFGHDTVDFIQETASGK